MSRFYVGGKAICVNPYHPLLKMNGVYPVLSIYHCCMDWLGIMPDDGSEDQPCLKCGAYGEGGDSFLFFEASAFRPLEEADLTAQIARDWKETVPVEQEVVNPVPEPAMG